MSVRRANGLSLSSHLVQKSLWDLSYTEGIPSEPVLTVESDGNLSWTAVTGSAGATLGYGVSIFPTGPTVTISGTTATISGYSPGTTYSFYVWGVNSAGRGPSSALETMTVAFNAATGGTTADITNYLGTGETWRTHTFTSSSNLVVTSAFLPAKVLLVANGSGGGGGRSTSAGGGGAGGYVYTNETVSMTASTMPVVVGAPTTFAGLSSSSGPRAGQNGSGPTSSVSGTSTNYGGGGGAGGNAGPGIGNIHSGPPGQTGGAGGGGRGGRGGTPDQASNGWGGTGGGGGTAGLGGGGGGGGGSANGANTGGGGGGTGRCIISYRIA